jgi:hypothetical protein
MPTKTKQTFTKIEILFCVLAPGFSDKLKSETITAREVG